MLSETCIKQTYAKFRNSFFSYLQENCFHVCISVALLDNIKMGIREDGGEEGRLMKLAQDCEETGFDFNGTGPLGSAAREVVSCH